MPSHIPKPYGLYEQQSNTQLHMHQVKRCNNFKCLSFLYVLFNFITSKYTITIIMVLAVLTPQGFNKEHQLGNAFQYQTICILHLTALY